MHLLVFFLVSLAVLSAAPVNASPEGQMTMATTVSLAARWFDPAEAEGIIISFIYYYVLHDALVKPMPGKPMAPSLARPRPHHQHGGLGALRGAQAQGQMSGGHCRRRREQAQKHLTTATTMYRDMGMTYWLEQAEAELRQFA